MPIVYNKETGLAENLPDEAAAQSALQSGTHEVPLVDPDGNPGSAPASSVPGLLAKGYKQPNPAQLSKLHDEGKYGTTEQKIITGLEGAAEASTFGLSTGLQTDFGVDPRDIQKRRETNPGSHMLGEIAGLGAGLLTGSGEAQILTNVGKAVESKVARVLGEGVASKIGSVAAREAAENTIYQMGSEVSKAFSQDPNQSVETAMSEIGLAAVLGAGVGGAFGTTSQLWKMGPGKNVESMLNALANKSSGLPSELKTAANINLTPEVEAALGGGEHATRAASALLDSGSARGEAFQRTMKDFDDSVRQALPEAMGRSAADIDSISNTSKFEEGKKFQDQLGSAIDERIKPISEQYNKLAEQFQHSKLTEADKASISDRVQQLIVEQGLLKGPNESAAKLAAKVIDQIPLQETAADLRKYIQGLNSAVKYDSENYQVAKGLRTILEEAEENAITKSISLEAPAELGRYKTLNAEYGQFKGLLEELNDRLHLGKTGGAGGFVKALKAMDPETVVNRLRLKDDVGLQTLLAEKFPEVAELARQQELNVLIKKSMAANGESIDPKKLFKQIDALSPELRGYLISEQSQKRIDAIRELVNRTPKGQNTSRTAAALDKMWKHIPAGAGGVIGAITGQGIAGAIIGSMTQWLGREAPDAIKLAMLKYVGSDAAVNSSGLKAAVSMAAASIKADNNLTKAAKAIFNSGSMPVISHMTQKERDKLQERIDHLVANRQDAMSISGDVGHYLPQHASAMALSSARVVTYLTEIKPNTTPKSLLDKPVKINAVAEASYNRALDIAQNPMLVMQNIKNGTLSANDIKHLANMYPRLYVTMKMKLETQMIEAVHDKVEIPYKTKLAMSMFLGQNLDSSISPEAIIAAQPQMQPMSPPGQPGSKATPARADKLKDLSKSYLTPSQSRIQQKTGAH